MAKKKSSEPAGLPVEPPAPALPPLRLQDVAGLIGSGRLDVAAGLALAALDRRAAGLDEAAAVAAAVIRGYQATLAAPGWPAARAATPAAAYVLRIVSFRIAAGVPGKMHAPHLAAAQQPARQLYYQALAHGAHLIAAQHAVAIGQVPV